MNTYRRQARHITRILFIAQSLGSAGFIAAATINAIAGMKLSGQPALAGLPGAIYSLGAALAAIGWSLLSDRFGRRVQLGLGLVAGIAGASLAAGAVVIHSFGLLLCGLALMGTAQGALQLARFAAAEVYSLAERGRALSTVVMGGALGAIFGPLLVGPVGTIARTIGVDELAGPYAIAVVLFAVGAIVIFLSLRPDPRDLGRLIAQEGSDASPAAPARPLGVILRMPGTILAVTTMLCGQLTMVTLMGITSLHMESHHHALPSISLVVSSHTFGMYAFSILSGRLVDHWGRIQTIALGSIALVFSCLLAPLSPAVAPLTVALFLLGLGWNFCFVGGSALLADQLAPVERARTQGVNDLTVGLTSALGSFGSGVIFGTAGYGLIAIVSAIIAIIPVVVMVRQRLGQRAAVAA